MAEHEIKNLPFGLKLAGLKIEHEISFEWEIASEWAKLSKSISPEEIMQAN